jgi:hypothetical protein
MENMLPPVNAKALQSLRDEMQLQGILDKPSWASVHSHHFFDIRDNVWRELDAVASRSWRGVLQKRPIRVKVVVLVESKRLAEKQLLLPRFNPLRQAIIYDWLGSQRRRKERFAVYEQAGLDPRLAQRVDIDISGGAADIMPNAPNILRPPSHAEWNAAGFIEAQNGQGKVDDPESAVVWRARLALRSAAQALAQMEIDSSSQDLLLALQFARLKQFAANQANQTEEFDLYTEILTQMRDRVFTITVFHPIVVVDAALWGVSPDDLVAVQHARIHLTGVSRYPYYWFDVARRDAAASVISAAQTGYDRQAAEKGLVPEEPNMGLVDYEIAHP